MFNPDSYIVFNVEAKVPGNAVTLKGIKAQIAVDNSCEANCVNAYKEKWAKNPLYKQVVSTINKHRNIIYDKSSPWGRRTGERIATKEMWLNEIESLAAEAESEVQKEVMAFVDNYEYVKTQAKRSLGSLYIEEDYPKKEDIKDNFYIFIGGGSAPDPDDNIAFGCQEVEKRFKERMEKKIRRNLEIIIEEINSKVIEIVGRVVDRLENYTIEEDGKVKNIFRDSLITNAKDLSEIMSYMNINNNADIEKMRKRIAENICKYEPSELRESPEKRESIAREAREILSGLPGIQRG